MQLKLSKIILPVLLFIPSILTAEDPNNSSDASSSILSEIGNAPKTTPKANNVKSIADFAFTDLDGKKHNFNEYKGKWVIVNYWATYCPPCRVEVTDLDIFAREHKNTAVVLGLDAGGDPIAELKQFKKEYELSYTMAPAQRSTLLAFGIIDALPTTFVVSPQGKITNKHVGMITYDDLYYYTNSQKK